MNMRPLSVPQMVVMKVLSVGMEYSGSGSRCISPVPGSPPPPGNSEKTWTDGCQEFSVLGNCFGHLEPN